MVDVEALALTEEDLLLAGKFPASPEQNDFFVPRFRWRNDAELASYAWSNQGKQGQSQVNMLMTESRMPMAGRMHCYSSDGAGSSCGNVPQNPSLMDYDAIDRSWRYDIEHEKSRVPEYTYRPIQTRNAYDEQYEKDLQVLHDKGFMNQLTAEENTRYEELSKAQFADFYQSVARKAKGIENAITLVDISDNVPSSSAIKKPLTEEDIHPKIAVDESNAFDNVTTVYATDRTSEKFDQVFKEEVVEDPINATITIPEDDYLAYFSNSQVIQDLSASAAEQGQEAFDAVLHKIVDGHEIAHVETEFTPFDEPLPFAIDDEFFDSQEGVMYQMALELEVTTNTHKERSYSPSSGFVSGSERSCTPNSQDDSLTNNYRLHGKLIPENVDEDDDSDDDGDDRAQRRRGRQSKDNELVRKYNLPNTAEELALMTHKILQRVLKDPALSEAQRSLIKKIRRRGRNKEAARKCRERKTEPKAEGSSRFVVYPPTR